MSSREKNKDNKKSQWLKVGESKTSPIENKERKEVLIDEYYVVVGFEVNNPKAFVDDTHDLGVDYGHAFFYEVKNELVTRLFSFGPDGAGKAGWFGAGGTGTLVNNYNRGAILKDGYKNARPGTPDYGIPKLVKAFRLPLTLKQGLALETKTDEMRANIINGKQKYTAYVNDTCAETAQALLTSAGIDTPSGYGWVKHSGVLNMALAYAVNPYKWYKNFTASSYSKTENTLAEGAAPKKMVGHPDPLYW